MTGYRVERCQGAGCTTFAQIGTPAGATYADTGLTAGTSYSYRVRATDAAGQSRRLLEHGERDHDLGGHDAADGAVGSDRDRGRQHQRSI